MNTLSYKTGYWSAVSLTLTFIVWVIAFVGIALTSPLFYWTNLENYIAYVQSNSRFFQNLAFLFMLLSAPAYVSLINSFYEYAPDEKKPLVRLGLLFGLGFAITSGINYFIQISAVRLSMNKGNFNGLEYFIQANPDAITTSIAMLGWTLFLGLSTLFIFPVFTGGRIEKVLKITFIFNSISCLLAGIGYVLQINVLTFLFVNIGTGGALLIISIASIRLFSKLIKEA